MPRRVLVGIDLGTTVMKAAAFDRSTGKMLAGVSQRLPTTVGPGGEREQDARRLWSIGKRLLGQLTREVGRRGRVDGIGLAAQGGSAVVVDRVSAQPKSPLFLWNDMRFLPYMEAIKKAHPQGYWRRLASRDEPGWGLARMLWMRETFPGLLTSDRMYVGIGELFFHKLTGVWQQDACNAHQIGCYDAKRHALSQRALEPTGTSINQIAPLREGTGAVALCRAAAAALGLPEGIDVIGPFMDHEAGFMSVDGAVPRPLQCSLGTAWVGNYAVSRRQSIRSPFHFVLPGPMNDDRLIIQPLLTGNVCWDWALTRFLDSRLNRALGRAKAVFERSVLPHPGLVALPWVNMPNTLWPQCLGSGAFFGMRATTGPDDLVRAVALSMVCELRRVFEQPATHGLIRSLVLGGGSSKGDGFRKLIASAFAPLPIYTVEDEDWAGTRGALRPFSNKVGCVPVTRLRDKHQVKDEAFAPRMQQYLELYRRLYGGEKSGQAIRVGKGPSS
ncbi:MAG: FGGY family carbohydrate kinase [Phycisphaerales bacterium]